MGMSLALLYLLGLGKLVLVTASRVVRVCTQIKSGDLCGEFYCSVIQRKCPINGVIIKNEFTMLAIIKNLIGN